MPPTSWLLLLEKVGHPFSWLSGAPQTKDPPKREPKKDPSRPSQWLLALIGIGGALLEGDLDNHRILMGGHPVLSSAQAVSVLMRWPRCGRGLGAGMIFLGALHLF